jgi:hypothetical protein
MVLNSSIRGAWGIDFLGYLGFRASRRVLGRWKETEVLVFLWATELVPLRAAFLAALALASAGEAEKGAKGGNVSTNTCGLRTTGSSATRSSSPLPLG